MNRRELLGLACGGLLGTASGCLGSGVLGDGNGSTPGDADECVVSNALETAPAIDVTADGTFSDAETTVDLAWNARTQGSATESPDDFIGVEAESGQTLLVFRLEVTNPTDDVVRVDRFNFELDYQTPDVVETVSALITGLETIDVGLRSGGTADGILVFSVPNETTEATLRPAVANFPDRTPLAFDPTCDETLDVDTPRLGASG